MINNNKNSVDAYPEKFELEQVVLNESFPPQSKDRQTHWFSIYIAAILSFLGCIQLGLYFSSVWPYLQVIDKNVTETFLGFVIAAYSLGDLISSPLFGYWSNKIGKIKPLLYFGFSFMLFGNLIYISAGIAPFHQRYFILFARFFTGFGFSYVSLLRAYAVSASIASDRSKAIAYITGGIALGSTTGPAIQLIFTSLGTKGYQIFGDLHFNIFTGPAILACAINLFAYFLIYFCFKERNIGVIDKNTEKEKGVNLPSYCKIAVAICYLTSFCQLFVVINLETINAPLAMSIFAFSKTEVVKYTAMAELFRCMVAFISYFSYIIFDLGKKFNSRKVAITSMAGLLAFHLITYSWLFLPGTLKVYSNENLINSNTSESLGCNVDKYQWCESFNPINPFIYYISFIIFIGAAFPNLNVSLNTIFSKIIGPRPQTIEQGWLQVSSSLGRMVGPITMSAVYVSYGPRWSWNVEIALLLMTLFCWILMKQKMIPLIIPKEYSEFHDVNDPDVIKKRLPLEKNVKNL